MNMDFDVAYYRAEFRGGPDSATVEGVCLTFSSAKAAAAVWASATGPQARGLAIAYNSLGGEPLTGSRTWQFRVQSEITSFSQMVVNSISDRSVQKLLDRFPGFQRYVPILFTYDLTGPQLLFDTPSIVFVSGITINQKLLEGANNDLILWPDFADVYSHIVLEPTA